MALRTTPTIVICLTAGVAAGVALARPGDPSTTAADDRYESVSESSGGPGPGYDEPIDLEYGAPPPAAGADPHDGSAGSAAAITIEGFEFSGPVTVAPGAGIAVTNLDSAAHTLTSDDGLFDTGRLGGDETVAIVAPEAAGSYSFVCEIHPSMTGSLTVG